MQIRRHSGAALAVGALGLVALAGCGGTSTKATPLVTTPTVRTSTTAVGAPAPAKKPTPTTAMPTTGSTVAPPTAAQLAAVQRDLDSAGNALAGGSDAINASDVNQAQAEEGSAP